MGHSPAMRTIGIGATSGNGGPFDLGPSAIYAAIDNPDALHERAASAGAEIVMGSPTKSTALGSSQPAISRATCGASAPTPRRLNRRWHHAGWDRGKPNSSGQRVSRPQSRFARHMTASLRLRVPHRPSAAAQARIDRVLPLHVHVYASVMIVGEATTTVSVPPSEVFDFVLDLNRYRQADHKIGRVGATHRTGDTGTVRFSGRIRGLPGPAGTYPFKLSASRLQFGSPVAGAARWFPDFEGTFDCQETENGTVVTHREVFEFKRPWRWLAEPVLRRWLETDTDAEMVRFKDLLDADSNSSNAAPA